MTTALNRHQGDNRELLENESYFQELREKVHAILFDWDCTLVDTWDGIFKAVNGTLVHFGLEPWSQEDAKNRVQESGRDAFPKLFGERAGEAQKFFYKLVEADHLKGISVLEGAHDLLKFLAQAGIPLGVVSNKMGPLLRKEVAHLGWEGYFGAIVGAGDADQDKPAADPVLLALRELKTTPSQKVWVVGDAPVDWECAASAGCCAIAIGQRFDPTPLVFVSIENCRDLQKFFSKL